MKKRVLILGNNNLSRECYINGVYTINNEKYINDLYKKYDVDNLSNDNLNSVSAYNLVKGFIAKNKYSACIISFGYNDLLNNKVELYEENLQKILNMVSLNGVECILMEINKSKDLDVEIINEIIRKYKAKLNLKKGHDGFNINKVQLCN